MRPALLSQPQLDEQLKSVEGWDYHNNSISRKFKFKNFTAAFAFMTAVALEADKLDHHPNWSNVYNTVDITLSTHDAGGLTELDIKLARIINKIALNGI